MASVGSATLSMTSLALDTKGMNESKVTRIYLTLFLTNEEGRTKQGKEEVRCSCQGL